MEETPEEQAEEQAALASEAERIDVHKYRRRYRLTMGVLAAAFCAAVVWVALHMAAAGRNPCERVRDHFCRKAPDATKCRSYQEVYQESVEDQSSRMRGVIRDQCLTKITRMKEEDGIVVE